jgi:type IV fimbrial biogenesis protein FimT
MCVARLRIERAWMEAVRTLHLQSKTFRLSRNDSYRTLSCRPINTFTRLVMSRFRKCNQGFTLLELLIVLAIVALLAVLATPAVTALLGTEGLGGAAYTIGDELQQARAYAMGNSTYVFVGFAECDASVDATATTQPAGTGRVVIAAVASQDGTLNSVTGNSNLVTVFKPRVFENLHIVGGGYVPNTYPDTQPTLAAPMQRPTADVLLQYPSGSGSGAIVNGSVATCVPPFTYPLTVAVTGKPKYTFNEILTFDPHGAARVLTGLDAYTSATLADAAYVEIDLQQTHGNLTPPAPQDTPSVNYAAIQCDGLSGAVRTYR